MRPKPHHVEIDDGDPNEEVVLVTVNAEDNEVIDVIEIFAMNRQMEAHALGHRLARVFELPLKLIEHYGAEPKPITVKA
jgi:hypothetical protein